MKHLVTDIESVYYQMNYRHLMKLQKACRRVVFQYNKPNFPNASRNVSDVTFTR